jgi:hypothetical protein
LHFWMQMFHKKRWSALLCAAGYNMAIKKREKMGQFNVLSGMLQFCTLIFIFSLWCNILLCYSDCSFMHFVNIY